MKSSSPPGHIPVMLETALELLACRSGGLYVDGTLGGGGYAEAILRASTPDGVVLGLDWDIDAIIRVRDRLHTYQKRLLLEKASFADLHRVLEKLGLGPVDGIVIDLGVSSFQLDDPARGFSFTQEGPLDMRMDKSLPRTAADLVNTLSEEDLAHMVRNLGEERWARRIARAIVARRRKSPIVRTLELAELIRGVVPKTRDARRIHPATRTFQALRLAVNKELDALEAFFDHALDVLKPGGRLCVVAFHSLEDRIVKERFKEWSKSCRCPQESLLCACEGKPLARILTKKPLRPRAEEIEENPRARSAKLRAAEKIVSTEQ